MTDEQARARAAFLEAFNLGPEILLLPVAPDFADDDREFLVWMDVGRDRTHPDALADVVCTAPPSGSPHRCGRARSAPPGG